METQRLFTYQSDGNIDKHKVITADEEQAQELLASGKAVKLDMPELTEFERKASELHANYKKEVERIKTSDNPLMTDEVKAYEIDKLDKQMREQSAAIEQEYKEWRQAQLDEAKTRAAQAVVKVTDDDRAVAEQFRNRASLRLASAGDKGVALIEIKNEINLLTDEQKTALQGEIANLLAGIDGNETYKQAIIEAVQDIRNSDLLAVKVAEQLPFTVLTEQRTYDIAKQVVSEPSGFTGGIDTEFYEKHLKGKGSFN